MRVPSDVVMASLFSFTEGLSCLGEWTICLPNTEFSDVRLHGQLHPQAVPAARKVHDEQRPRELHSTPGKSRHTSLLL